MVVVSILEVFSLGMVIPFLGVLSSPQKIFDSSYFQYTIYKFPILASINLQIVITVIFCLVAMIAGLTRVLLMWLQTRFSHAIGADFSYAIYKQALFQPYSVHISRNSSEIISGIVNKSNGLLTFIVLPTLTLLSSISMICFILATVILFNPVVALVTFGGFGVLYFIVMSITKNQLKIDAQRINEYSTSVIKALQEGLGGIRDVLLDRTQYEYLKLYKQSDNPLRRSQANVQIISSAPRFIIEAIGLVFIGLIAFNLSTVDDGFLGAIPLLGLIALGAQRLLPLMQQSYMSYVNLKAGAPMLIDVLRLLESKTPENDCHFKKIESDALEFRKYIDIEGVSFAYDNSDQFVFSNLNISIPKGSRVGIVGKTGCGKSTFCDVLMGLLLPSEGCIKIDGLKLDASNIHQWQKQIAHVPQSIFLVDSTVEENIAFGVNIDNIDHNRIIESAIKAGIHSDIVTWSNGYQTRIGERGIQISGGQRQRIGIARALYKNADVIFFDEATSALDGQTEKEIIAAINSLSKELTIITVAHRTTTLKSCDLIISLQKGGLNRVGTYDEILRGTAN